METVARLVLACLLAAGVLVLALLLATRAAKRAIRRRRPTCPAEIAP
jgi:Flp pilus assembly protein protease CpaA